MAKNMTRKGLALGAAFALAGSALVASPAQAAGEVVFVPTAGTSYATFVTESFSLSASLAAGQVASNISQLKYQVEKPAAVVLTTQTTTGATAALAADSAANSTKYVIAPASPSATVANKVSVTVKSASATTDSVDVVVSAFIDSNANDALDAGEFVTARTVSFKKYADVAASIDLTQPIEDDTTAKATMSFVGINADQLTASDITVSFNSATAVTATDGVFTSASFTALDADEAVSVQAKFKTVNVGTAVSKNATAATIASITGSIVEGANAKVISSENHVRINSAFTVKAVAKDGATTPATVAGVALTASVATGATLSGTAGSVVSITVNGTTYTANADLPSAIALTTDANGEVSLAIDSEGLAADDTITVVFSGQNVTTAARTVVTKQKAAALTVTNDGGAYAKTTKGGTVALAYTVQDQFGQAPTGALRLAVSAAGTGYTVATQYPAVVNGAASVSVTAAPATQDGDLTVSSVLQSQGLDSNWSNATATNAADVVVTVTDTADAFDTNPAATASGTISRVDSNGDLTNAVTLTGSLNNAGAKVVVSAAGLKFGWNGSVYTDSVVITSGATGNFSVDVYSHAPGKDVVVTFAAGTETKTSKVTWAAAAAIDGKTLTISVDNAVSGATMTVTGLLVDEYGNAVDSNQGTTAGTNLSALSVAYSGPGLVIGDLPTETDADGKFSFKVLLGSNDVVSGTVTATYGGANGVIGTGDDDITTVKSLAAEAVATWTKNLGSGEVKMYAKNIVGAGKVQFMLNGAEVAWVRAVDGTDPKLRSANGFYYLVRTVELVEGQKNVLEIYVDGVRTTRTAYTY